MPIASPLTDMAFSVRRRISTRWRRHFGTPAPAGRANPPAPPDAFALAATDYLRERILERRDGSNEKHIEGDLNHMRRFVTSLRWLPREAGRVLDPAAGNGLFTGLVRRFLNCELEIPPYFNLEKEPAPYPDASFDGVVLMEVLEHFTVDPMHALAEFNRVLKPGGFLFLTTPNLSTWRAIHSLIHNETPYLHGVFEKTPCPDRHNREYTWKEVGRLAADAGFRVERLEGINVYPSHDDIPPVHGVNPENRGDTTFLLARKDGPVRDRHPDWLYVSWDD